MTSAASVTSRPARIVDSHVHLWDPARTDWYPYLSASHDELNMGDVSGMSRRFDVRTYQAEAAGWNVEKLVNVAAATGGHSIEETLELDHRADVDGHPDAIVGGLLATEVGYRGNRTPRSTTRSATLPGRPTNGGVRGVPAAGRGAACAWGTRPALRG